MSIQFIGVVIGFLMILGGKIIDRVVEDARHVELMSGKELMPNDVWASFRVGVFSDVLMLAGIFVIILALH